MAKWITRRQLAEKLGVHPNSIVRYEKRPGFPKRSTALGNPRWEEAKIDRYMKRMAREEARAEARAKKSAASARPEASEPRSRRPSTSPKLRRAVNL